jgi:hypothetical protein
MHKRLVWFLLCGVLSVPPVCSAFRFTVLPRLTLSEEFTDNVDLSSEDQTSDFITSISPGVTVGIEGQDRQATLSYDPSIAVYARSSDIATRHNARLTATNRFTQHSILDLSNAFTRTDDPFASREISFTRTVDGQPPPDETRRRGREPYWNNAANVAFRHQLSEDDSFFVSYANTLLRNDDQTVEDSTRHEPSLGLTWWVTPRYGVEAKATYAHADFSQDTDPFNQVVLDARFIRKFTQSLDAFIQAEQTIMNFQGETEDYNVYQGTLGVDYNLSETTFFTLSTGLFYQDPVESGGQTGYVVQGDMARRFSRGSVRLSGGTGYRETFGGAENLGFTEFYEGLAAAEYRFTRRLAATGQAGYTHNTYEEEDEREDDILTVEAGLSYLIRPWLSSSLRYTYRDFESTEPGDSYVDNRVTLSLTFVPTRPWFFE